MEHSLSRESGRWGRYPVSPDEAVVAWPHAALLVLLLCAGTAYVLSESVGYGDAPFYAEQIAQGVIIDPGHFLWRPFGAAVFAALLQFGYHEDPLWILQAMSLGGSLASIAIMFIFLRRFVSPATALLGAALFAFSNGFWFYSMSGCSYSIGLFFSLLALVLMMPPPDHPLTVARLIGAGICGALSALFWLVYGLTLPILVGLLVLAHSTHRAPILSRLALSATVLVFVYSTTLGLPLLVTYLALPLLDPYVLHEAQGQGHTFLGWLLSSAHGIKTIFGPLQIMRWVWGWAQSVVAMGDFGQTVKLWLVENGPVPWLALFRGAAFLMLFYGCLAYSAYSAWASIKSGRDSRQRGVLILCGISLGANTVFAWLWDATSLERYFPSIPFLVLLVCTAYDRLLPRWSRWAIMVLMIFAAVNFSMTIYPGIAADSFKGRWIQAISQHLKREDLLIILGPNKYNVTSPHVRNRPEIVNVSMLVVLYPGPDAYREILKKRMEEVRQRGGRVMLGDSVLGLSLAPRDGWSFREHTVPSPKDLDEFFSPMKSELVFSVGEEHVWLAK